MKYSNMTWLIFQQLDPLWIQQFLFFMWSRTIDQKLWSIFVSSMGGCCVMMEGKWWCWRHISSYPSQMNFWSGGQTKKNARWWELCMCKQLWIAWTKMFLNLHVFNKSNILVQYYPSDEEVHITMSELWLERLDHKLWIDNNWRGYK
jgi:hypothetical protein